MLAAVGGLLAAAPAHAAQAQRPVTVLATGDSMIQLVDTALRKRLAPQGVRVPSDARISTGISKPRLLDWQRLAREQARRWRPRATVMFLGANDGFNMRTARGRLAICCGKAWRVEYARRARRMMRAYARHRAGYVYWLLLPQAREGFFTRSFPAVNAALRRAARALPRRVRLVHLNRVFTPRGRFRDYMRRNGRRVRVRQRDGIHLSAEGAAIAASLVVRRMRADGVLRRG
ncbi:MAG TPA: DUF459 domain-containing protein [Thermoleophilaceae bacterium]